MAHDHDFHMERETFADVLTSDDDYCIQFGEDEDIRTIPAAAEKVAKEEATS